MHQMHNGDDSVRVNALQNEVTRLRNQLNLLRNEIDGVDDGVSGTAFPLALPNQIRTFYRNSWVWDHSAMKRVERRYPEANPGNVTEIALGRDDDGNFCELTFLVDGDEFTDLWRWEAKQNLSPGDPFPCTWVLVDEHIFDEDDAEHDLGGIECERSLVSV